MSQPQASCRMQESTVRDSCRTPEHHSGRRVVHAFVSPRWHAHRDLTVIFVIAGTIAVKHPDNGVSGDERCGSMGVAAKEPRPRTRGMADASKAPPPPAGWQPAIVLASSLLIVSLSAQQQTPPPQNPDARFRFKGGVELINITAIVSDSSGRFVPGLRKDDFVVYEDDQPQEVIHFSTERVPVSLGVALDTSGSMAGERIQAAQRALDRLLDDLLAPDDEIFLYRFSDRPTLVQGWTTDRQLLRQALRRLPGPRR